MKHVKLIGLALVAVFALVAVAATGSASAAEPEWGHCVAVKSKGHYEDSNCTKEDVKESKSGKKTYKGKFEWAPGAAAACFAQKKGHYKDSACTEEDFKENSKTHVKTYKGKYEKTGGPKFEGNGGAGVLDALGMTCEGAPTRRAPHAECAPGYGYGLGVRGQVVECKTEHATGEALGTDEVANVNVTFKGCIAATSYPATSPGHTPGEIVTFQLKGRLGYINKANHEVGVLLQPATAGGLFAEFEIGEQPGEILEKVGVGNATEGAFYEEIGTTGNDGVISPITPVNHMSHTFTQNYRIEEAEIPCHAASCEDPEYDAYRNTPNHFEGGPLEALEFAEENVYGFESEWSAASEEVTNVNTDEGEAEIKG